MTQAESRIIHFKNTAAGGVIGIGIVAYAFVLKGDVFDYLVELLAYLEHYEIDEIIMAAGAILFGLLLDLVLMKRQKERHIELQEQRVKVLKATMRTVQDIVNNFLNNLIFFRMEAETKGALSESSLRTMDSLIHETSAKLNALGELEEVPEKLNGLSGIDYSRNPPPPP